MSVASASICRMSANTSGMTTIRSVSIPLLALGVAALLIGATPAPSKPAVQMVVTSDSQPVVDSRTAMQRLAADYDAAFEKLRAAE